MHPGRPGSGKVRPYIPVPRQPTLLLPTNFPPRKSRASVVEHPVRNLYPHIQCQHGFKAHPGPVDNPTHLLYVRNPGLVKHRHEFLGFTVDLGPG
jgi:hypothetical protein